MTMKKKTVISLAVAVVMMMAVIPTAPAGGVCDPQKSHLCMGLVDWWNFDEANDSYRVGAYRDTILLEEDGVNVGVGTAKLGTASAGPFASAALTIPRYGDLSSYSTVAMWVWPVNRTTDQFLWSTVVQRETYSGSGSYNSSGSWFWINTSGQLWFAEHRDEDDSFTYSNLGTSAIPLNQWSLIVVKLSPYGPYGKAQACGSINNAAFQCVSTTYNHRFAPADLWIGAAKSHTTSPVSRFSGYIDGLGVWSRAWSPKDMAEYYNSGTGRAFPFY
jgi:hypothetical protein